MLSSSVRLPPSEYPLRWTTETHGGHRVRCAWSTGHAAIYVPKHPHVHGHSLVVSVHTPLASSI